MKQARIPWTAENKASLRGAALAGDSELLAMCKRHACSMLTLRNAIRRFKFERPSHTHRVWGGGRSRRHVRWTREIEAKIEMAAGIRGGLSALAASMGVAVGTVCRHAKRLGLQSEFGALQARSIGEMKNGVKTCTNCGLVKQLSDYYMSKGRPSVGTCRTCTVSGRYFDLRSALGRTRAHENGWTLDSLEDMFHRRQGRCFYTGLYMDFRNFETSPSVDRLDSSRGYTKDNVVMCCRKVNIMKNTISVARFTELCRLVAKQHPGE